MGFDIKFKCLEGINLIHIIIKSLKYLLQLLVKVFELTLDLSVLPHEYFIKTLSSLHKSIANPMALLETAVLVRVYHILQRLGCRPDLVGKMQD